VATWIPSCTLGLLKRLAVKQLLYKLILKNCRFKTSVTMTPVKRRKR